MIERIVTQVLQKYLYQYLQNFDESNLNISLLRGRIDLKDLELNDNILKNMPIPLSMKYGRIGSIHVELPSLLQLAHPKIKVNISDIFICLTIKEMKDWDKSVIQKEYQDDKDSTLQHQENDSKFIFEEYKGDDEKMNKYLLQLIQNIQVSIKRIYIRLEDPVSPFCIGVLLPSIDIETTDKNWNPIDLVKGEPEIMHKMIQVNEFQIFMEQESEKARIDEVLKLYEIEDEVDFKMLLEHRIRRHIDFVFSDEFDCSNVLHKFYMDIRFQVILDKARAMENNSEWNEPDIKLQILFGDLFKNLEQGDSMNWLRLRIYESQIHKIVRFLTYTGLFNTYRLGVLRDIFERPLDVNSEEIKDYLALYEEYLGYKSDNNTEKMTAAQIKLKEIEKHYRIDLLFMLRKLVQERYYGMLKATHYKQERMRELENVKQRIQSRGFFSRIPFFGKKEEDIQQNIIDQDINCNDNPERRTELKKIDLAYKIIKFMYQSRYKSGLEDLDKYSKLKHDPYFTFQSNKINTIMAMEFQMPKSQIEIFQDLTQDKTEIEESRCERSPVFDSVIEGLEVTIISETKPQYFGIQVTLDNIYIYDHHSKNKSLPYVMQTIISDELSQVREMTALEIFYEINPKKSKVATHRLKFHNLGQLYIYTNLDFATTTLRMWTRLIAEVNNSFAQMIESADQKIQEDINKGDFYQQMLQKVVSEKQDQFYDMLERITHGNYDPPSLDLDIKMISPKIILYEKLINQNYSIEDHPLTIILDLGTIQADTRLLKKIKDYDYSESENIAVLFDKITVKFGKMRLYMDYNLHILHEIKHKFTCDSNEMSNQFERHNKRIQFKSELQLNNKCTNWKPSEQHSVVIFDDVNFGFQIKTCLVPFHKVQPSQVLNFKFNELKVNKDIFQSIILVKYFKKGVAESFDSLQRCLARKYAYTLEQLIFLEFMKQLNLFLSQPPPRPPLLKDENGNPISQKQLQMQGMTTQEREKELQSEILSKKIQQRHSEQDPESVTLLQSIKRLIFDQTIEDVKQKYKSSSYDETKKAVTIQMNFVFQQMTIAYQEVQVNYKEDIENQNYYEEYKEGDPLYEEQQFRYNKNNESGQGRKVYGVTVKQLFDFGITNIKGQLDFRPKEVMNYVFLLGKLLVTYKDQDQDTQYYKYLILNPQDTQLDNNQKSRFYKNHSEVNAIRFKLDHTSNFNKLNPMNQDINLDFTEFENFKPKIEANLSHIQLSVFYEEVYNDNKMVINLGNIRLVFIVPLIHTMYKAYADSMIDSYKIDQLVKESLAAQEKRFHKKTVNMLGLLQQQKTNKFNKLKTQSTSAAFDVDQRFSSRDNSQKKKSFLLDKAYQNEHEEQNEKNLGKQKPSGTLAKSATLLMKMKHDPKDQLKIEPDTELLGHDRNKKDLIYKNRQVRSFIEFRSKLLEVVIPSNLHEENSLCLRMTLRVDTDISRRTLYQDQFLPDSWETWLQSTVLNDASHIDTNIHHLAIFMENQGQKLIEANNEVMSQFTPLFRQQYQNINRSGTNKIFLLHPYEMQIVINSYTEIISENEAYSKTHLIYKSEKDLNLTAGLCELNSYLLLGQLAFSLLNEIMRMNKEINETTKHFNLVQKSEQEVQQDEQDQRRNQKEGLVEENRRMGLEEILTNENLIQNTKKSTVNRWKRATKLAVASTKRKDFFELINDFEIKGIQMHFVDNLTTQNLALITFQIDLKNIHMESRGFDIPSIYRMENLFQIERIKEQKDLLYFKLFAEMNFKGVYFNRANYSEEPFIENFPFQMKIKQRTPMSKSKQLLIGQKMLNINVTYGLACNLQRIIRTILDMEAEIKNFNDQNNNVNGGPQSSDNQNNEQQLSAQKNNEIGSVQGNHQPVKSKTISLNENILKQQVRSGLQSMISPFFMKNKAQSTPPQQNEYVPRFQQYQSAIQPNINYDRYMENIYEREDMEIPNELNETIDMPPEKEILIEKINYYNHTGLKILVCLSELTKLLQYKKPLLKRHTDEIQNEKDQQANRDIKLIEPGQNPVQVEIKEYWNELRQLKGIDFDIHKTSVKITFKVEGFKRVRNVVLQRNGVFGYYLIRQEKSKRDLLGQERSAISCVVRITRYDNDIHVHFESNLIIQNETQLNILLETRKKHSDQKTEHPLDSGKVLISPLTWATENTNLILLKDQSHQRVHETLFRKIKKAFNPQLIKASSDHSKVLFIQDQYIAMDIYFLKTKTNVGQFLIVFQPILTLHNLMFTEIQFDTLDPNHRRTLLHLNTNQIKNMTLFNPYDSHQKNECIFKNRVSENEYFTQPICLSLSKVKRHKDMFFKKGMIIQLTSNDVHDQTKNVTAHVVFEKISKTAMFKVNKYDNFNLRQQIFKKTKSLLFKIYAPYVAVNRTVEPIKIHGVHNGPVFMNPTSTLMIAPSSRKIKIEVEDYQISKPFLVNTLGITGTIKQVRLPRKNENGPQSAFSQEEQDSRETIEIGTYITQCPHPYSRTKVIKFQPRYRIVNQIGLAIVIMEEGSNHQIAITPDEEATLNLSPHQSNMIRVRLIDIERETKRYQQGDDNMIREEYKQNLTEKFANMSENRKYSNEQQQLPMSSQKPNLNEVSQQLSTPKQAFMNGENDYFDDMFQDNNRRYIDLNKDYALQRENRDIWSYKFQVKDLDDFQISVPNGINSMRRVGENGWQENNDKFFLRVSISPSPENDATIYLNFSYPMYPDYVFYNNTPFKLRIQHQPERKPCQNEVYELLPDQKDVIILNPIEKDEDFDSQGFMVIERPLFTFHYEIDSNYKHITFNDDTWHIETRATNNLRFIHFMHDSDYYKLRAREETELARYQEEHKQSFDQLDEFKMHEDDDVDLIFKERKNTNIRGCNHNFNHNSSSDSEKHDSRTHDNKVQESKGKLQCDEINFNIQKKEEEFQDELIESSLTELRVDLEGIGISFVDHQPRELCYISIYQLKMLQYQNYTKNKQGIEHNQRQVLFKLSNFQIDNMTPRSFPVILGPKKAFNFIESKLINPGHLIFLSEEYDEMLGRKSDARNTVYQSMQPKSITNRESVARDSMYTSQKSHRGHHDNNDSQNSDIVSFLQFQFDIESITDKKLTTQKINHFRIALTEISINFHQYFLNQMVQFIQSLTQLVPDEDIAAFTSSETMQNYNKLFELVTNQDAQIQLKQDGQNAECISDFESVIEIDQNEIIMQNEGQGQFIALQRRYTTNYKSLKTTNKKFKKMEKVCPFISPEPIKYSKGSGLVSSKTMVKEISIKALKIYLTFRVYKIQNAGNEGIANGLLNFFMNFANVSDAQLYFTEIEIFDAYTNLDEIQGRLMKHYIKQGIEQLYQVFGATDVIGNPVNLINNLGRGVEQLYSQPFKGAVNSRGNAFDTVVGLKDGIKSFAQITTAGISNSIARMTGTWYMSISNLSGRQISESNLDDPHTFHGGIVQGSKGLALEFGHGVTGVFTTPLQRVREEGKGFPQIAKGTMQGIVGFITAPVNGILRFVHSTSAGARNHAQGNEDSKLRRHRYPRYFNEMQIMGEYECLRSHAFAALISAENGTYRNENIHIFADISEKLDDKKQRFKERVLICTDERIIFIQSLYKIKAEIEIRDLALIQIQRFKLNKQTNASCGSFGNSRKIIIDTYPPIVIEPIVKHLIVQQRVIQQNSVVGANNSGLMSGLENRQSFGGWPHNEGVLNPEVQIVQQQQTYIQDEIEIIHKLPVNQSAMLSPSQTDKIFCHILLHSKAGTTQKISSSRVNQCMRFVERVNQRIEILRAQKQIVDEKRQSRNWFQQF